MCDDPRLLPLLATVLLLAGCAGPQSALDPAGPSSSSIHLLGIVMYVGATLVTLLVTVLMLVPFLRRRERRANHNLFLWGGGVALPGLTLTALVPYVLSVGGEMRTPTLSNHLTVDVTGHVYWWEMSYRRPDGLAAVTSANELRLPVGEPVEVFLHSADVIHSFWVPMHFLTVYAATAIACVLGLGAADASARSTFVSALVIATVAAAAVVVLHALKTYRRRGEVPNRRFLGAITIGHDAIATVAVLWQLFPILLVPVCQ